ncbi:MAG: Trp biosynthesis-associated membrane protein [Marmoricola sp.]
MTERPAPARPEWHGFTRVLLPGVAVAVLAAVASAKPWAALTGAGTRLVPSGSPLLTGVGEVPLASALSLVVLAAWGAVLVTRARVRTSLSGVGLVASLALLAVAVRGFWSAPDSVRHVVVGQLGLAGRSHAGSAIPVGHTGWYWVALVMALCCVVSFAVAVPRVHRWPTMSARYDAPGSEREQQRRRRLAQPRTDREWWDALDEGRDPTARPEPGHGPGDSPP